MSTNRVQVPGQTSIGCRAFPAPNATPVSMALSGGSVAELVVWGGLTKLEWMAGMVASGWYGAPEMPASIKNIVDEAEAILLACQEREKANATQKQNGQTETAGQ